MKKLLTGAGAGMIALMPVVALAQFNGSNQLNTLATQIINFINNTLIPLVFAVALLVFIWGMFRFFVYGAHKDDDRAAGKQLMIWALVGFVLMVSIWGIVNLVAGGLGFSGKGLENIPETPRTKGSSGGYSGGSSDCWSSAAGPC